MGALERKKSDGRTEKGAEWLEVREYLIDGQVVGQRAFDSKGALVEERPMRNGVRHGTCYFWDEGALVNAEPYLDGKMHGTCKQWDFDGTLLGTYEMDHGTGFDVWRCKDRRGRISISEIHPMKNGVLHGPDRWFAEDGTLTMETHFVDGKKHGIERQWDSGELRDGCPGFWLDGEEVTRQIYLTAVKDAPGLHPPDFEDDLPRRKIASEVIKNSK